MRVVAIVMSVWVLGAQAPEHVPAPSDNGVVPLPQPIKSPGSVLDLLPVNRIHPAVARALDCSAWLLRILVGGIDQEDAKMLLGEPTVVHSVGPYRHAHYPRLGVKLVFNDNPRLLYVRSLWLQRPETSPRTLRRDLVGLQGRWALVATEQHSKKVEEPVVEGLGGTFLLIEGSHLTVGSAVALPCRFRLSQVGVIGKFVLLAPTPGGEDEWRKFQAAAPTSGVYRLDGDRIQVQFRDRGDPPGFDKKSEKYPVLHFKKQAK
jgi:hypothetical protein